MLTEPIFSPTYHRMNPYHSVNWYATELHNEALPIIIFQIFQLTFSWIIKYFSICQIRQIYMDVWYCIYCETECQQTKLSKSHPTYLKTTNLFNIYINIIILTCTTYFFRQKQIQFVLTLQFYEWMDFPPYWIHRHAVLGLGTFTWSIRNQGVKIVLIRILLAKSKTYLKFKFWGKGNIAHPPNRYPCVTIKIGWCFPRASSDTKKLERFGRRRRYALVRGKTCPIKDKADVRIAETLVFCIYKIIIWNLFLFQNIIWAISAYLISRYPLNFHL